MGAIQSVFLFSDLLDEWRPIRLTKTRKSESFLRCLRNKISQNGATLSFCAVEYNKNSSESKFFELSKLSAEILLNSEIQGYGSNVSLQSNSRRYFALKPFVTASCERRYRPTYEPRLTQNVTFARILKGLSSWG